MYTVHRFNEVVPFIKKNTLVVCDLDYTLVHYGKPFLEFLNEARALVPSNQLEDYEPTAYDLYRRFQSQNPPIHTDPAGFIHLLMEVLTQGGKLIFVTCRSPEYEAFTRQEFKTLNLDYDFFEVHYIGSQSKGEFCRRYSNPGKDRDILLIDDYKKNHRSFHALIPGSKSFLFRI
jgi:hypothetical protein